jgi:hypothetical protein
MKLGEVTLQIMRDWVLRFNADDPELNVMENVWQFMRDDWLPRWAFTGNDGIVSLCCFHWKGRIEMPWRVGPDQRDWVSPLKSGWPNNSCTMTLS